MTNKEFTKSFFDTKSDKGFCKCCECGYIPYEPIYEWQPEGLCSCVDNTFSYYIECPKCITVRGGISHCRFCTNAGYYGPNKGKYVYKNGYILNGE